MDTTADITTQHAAAHKLNQRRNLVLAVGTSLALGGLLDTDTATLPGTPELSRNAMMNELHHRAMEEFTMALVEHEVHAAALIANQLITLACDAGTGDVRDAMIEAIEILEHEQCVTVPADAIDTATYVVTCRLA